MHSILGRTLKKGTLAHRAYLAAILIKGFDGALETIAGLVTAFAGSWQLYILAINLTAPELDLHPDNAAMHWVRDGAERLFINTPGGFLVFYLLVHGILKLAICIELLREKRWIFPVATVIFAGFVLYMGYHLTQRWSAWVLSFALFDLLTLALVVIEWRSRRGRPVP